MTIRTISSFQDLKTLQGTWERLQNHPNNDFEHYQLVCRLRREVESPYIVIIERDGKISAMVMARIERLGFSPAIGYFKPVRIPTRNLTMVYQGLLGDADEDACRLVVQHIRTFLETGQADLVSFHHLPEHSALLNVLKAEYAGGRSPETARWTKHWAMTLPEQPGFLLKKLRSKHRSWLANRRRKMESDYPGKVSWKWLRSFDDISDITARLEAVAARTYQRGLGAGFMNDEEHRRRYRLFADRGQLRIQLLEIEDEVKAFWIGTVYKGTFYSAETGYDPDFRIYELGTLIFFAMTDELVREGVSKIDFGLGDAFYKERYGDESWLETTVTIFAPNLKGRLLQASSQCVAGIDQTVRRLLQEAGMLDRLKTTLRSLMQGRSKSPKL